MGYPTWPRLVLVLACSSVSVAAQCRTTWVSESVLPGVDALVNDSIPWDPDGPGPQPELVVFAGDFVAAGNVTANGIVGFDPATGTWHSFGSGMNEQVFALAVLSNGDLVAGGAFTVAGGIAANRIARWDGSSWHALGAGLEPHTPTLLTYPSAIEVLSSGDLVVGGNFGFAGGRAVERVARWDGAAWSPLGAGLSGVAVNDLAVLPGGDIVASGAFSSSGAVPLQGVARWDGTGWQPMGRGPFNALHAAPSGSIYGGGPSGLSRWSGAKWDLLGGVTGNVWTIEPRANGELALGGINRVSVWNGASASLLGSAPLGHAFTLTETSGGELIVGGTFSSPHHVAKWDGTAWQPLNLATNGSVLAFHVVSSDDIYVGGTFTAFHPTAANRIAHFDGQGWQPLGSGLNDRVNAITGFGSGIIAGGTFTAAGGAAASRVAHHDGTGWHPLGSGVSGPVNALLTLANGDVVAAGNFFTAGGGLVQRIARWDGQSWSALGAGLPRPVLSLAQLPNGNVIAGTVGTVLGAVHMWDGSTWTNLGTSGGTSLPFGDVSALLALPNGDFIAAGSFGFVSPQPFSWVVRWNGSVWTEMAPAPAYETLALASLPGGRIVAGGSFTRLAGGPAVHRVAMWNAGGWQPLGNGVNGSVRALAYAGDSLLVGGDFTTAGSVASAHYTRWQTSCPATATELPTSCAGPVGAMDLTVDGPPWVGATVRGSTSGFAPSGLGIVLFGFQSPAVPLSQIHPSGVANCSLLSSTELLLLASPVGGVVASLLPVPNDQGLAGLTVYHQVLQVTTAGGQVALVGSNGLALTVGSF